MYVLSKQIDNNVAPCASTFPRDDRANDTVEKKNKIFFLDGITSRMASKCSFSQNCKALFYDLAFSQSNKNLFSTSVVPEHMLGLNQSRAFDQKMSARFMLFFKSF